MWPPSVAQCVVLARNAQAGAIHHVAQLGCCPFLRRIPKRFRAMLAGARLAPKSDAPCARVVPRLQLERL